MHHMTNKTPTPTKKKRIQPTRLSVPLSPQLLQAFSTLAKVEGRGTGAAVAEWLEGQAESVLFIAKQLQEVKTKPRAVMGALHSYAVAMSEETGKTMYQMAMEGEPAASEAKDLLRQIFGVKEAGTSIGEPQAHTSDRPCRNPSRSVIRGKVSGENTNTDNKSGKTP